jgi:DNA-binding transcriptional LysR family regulator
MELRHLEQIVAICRAGSFSGAAKELGIAQPTLSRSISRLEARLGVLLFERTNANARPTIYGQFVADQASSLLGSVTTLSHELEQMARGEAGLLRIGVGLATRLKPSPKVVRKAARAFPRLQIVTRYAGPNLMMRALRAGSFDLIFCNRELVTQDDFIRIKVFDDRYTVVARPDHPALKAAPLSAAEFMRLPLASAGLTPDFRAWLGPVTDAQRPALEAFSPTTTISSSAWRSTPATSPAARASCSRAS